MTVNFKLIVFSNKLQVVIDIMKERYTTGFIVCTGGNNTIPIVFIFTLAQSHTIFTKAIVAWF